VPTRRAKDLDFDPLEFAENALREACEIHGLGAKTAAGYGWFEFDEQATQRMTEEKAAKAEADAKAKALAAMSPEDRRVAGLGELPQDAFKQHINAIKNKPEAEQRIVLRALLEKHPGIWQSDKKAKPKKKAGKRAETIRRVAAALGVKLP